MLVGRQVGDPLPDTTTASLPPQTQMLEEDNTIFLSESADLSSMYLFLLILGQN